MKKIIVFDFNRTLYDPDNDCLITDVKFVLRVLIRRGFLLYLISCTGKPRKKLIKNIGISKYFSRIIVTKEKNKKNFERLAATMAVDRSSSFVVGDRVRKEISIGNSIGVQTVWLKFGKFANEKPRKKIERPTFTVSTLREILSIVF
ncbi:MAG: HAD family hydrolase [Candidatus Magasanikbacteria bacterium]|nr:HAD family hydrolase [Candidatus Magasanikbacteria bacterium]